MSFVHLHVHSQYSILNSSASIGSLVESAAAFEMPALALTDQGNLFGAIDFYKACRKRKVKPLLGCELYMAPSSRHEKKKMVGSPCGYELLFLAKDRSGYQNLCKLSSFAHLEGFYYVPRIDRELLKKHREGLICLSGGTKGFLSTLIAQDREEELIREIDWFQELFKEDFFFEVQCHRMTRERALEEGIDKEAWLFQKYHDLVHKEEKVASRLKEISLKRAISCVATNTVSYILQQDWRAHEILMNVQSGEPVEIWEKDSFGNLKERILNPKRKALATHEFYFKSAAEMQALFPDFPQALENTVRIAEACTVELDFRAKYYPVFVPPHLEGREYTEKERVKEAAKTLRRLSYEGIERRYPQGSLAKIREKCLGQDPLEAVKERLERELEIIISKEMCDYLLIVYDFIDWAKREGIPVGPGRGSGAGSIILYLIGVTNIDPLRFNLFFERFINPERISYPDIDVDICMEGRSKVIEYMVRKYGKEKVAQIITFGTMKAKMALKDVGRVLSIPLAKVNALSKLVPEDPTMTLKRALEIDPELSSQYEADPEIKRWVDLARTLEGSVRNTGVHAAGVIVSGDPITERIPVCLAKDSELVVTQYAMKPLDAVGMLKIDFLGLKTLTSIQSTVDAIRAGRGVEVDWVNLPLDDPQTFALLNQGTTQGIFQIESAGMQELVKQLHVDRFEEIIAVGALYRPGPMEMIPSFINRKHGREPIEIDHPLVKDILSETYGIMVYQEQVMEIASRLANYSLGEGDVLRKAMGKKDKEEMARQRVKFREGAVHKGIDPDLAMHIFDKIEKFASYGFNKSHAAAYAYLTYATAYLKAHYAAEWMAALMTSDREDISKVAKVIRECQAMKIPILPPDVNESEKKFVATQRGIRFALTAIKGVGEGVVEVILEERMRGSSFASLQDFLERLDTRKVGKKIVELLIFAGAFDFTGWAREQLLESLEPLYNASSSLQKEREKGVMNLLSLLDEKKEELCAGPPPIQEKMPLREILKKEYAVLGFYLTGHPLDSYRKQFSRLSSVPLSRLEELDDGSVIRCCGLVEAVKIRTSARTQRKFALVTLGDGIDRFEVPIWPELYAEKGALLEDNQLLYIILQIEKRDGEFKLHCRHLEDLTKLDERRLQDFEALYEKERAKIKNGEKRERKMAFKTNGRAQETSVKLFLSLDADSVRLSHILQLKKLFRSLPGPTPLHLEFYSQEKKVGDVVIAPPWGVEATAQLEEDLKKVPSIKAVRREN
ncbi:MAG TPA: DNA polymerase III subunit alpha [Parachlamydiales bacterium]|nr:MAG: DNA polymerase III subunit alpha [Chlamydiae bacterium GWA2_50_15]HAZ15413.1 DNA polymerase III subunit alpha [Parachlamydiales bacterium]